MQAAELFANTCLADIREDLDQQLIRLSSCQGGGSSLLSSPELDQKEILYELPQTALPVVAPLDATNIEPGVVVTEQPAPWLVSALDTETAPLPEEGKTTVSEFVKKNPLLVGGLAVVALYLLSKKKKR